MVKDPIFDSLKNIAQLPPSPSRNDDRLDDSTILTAESPAIEEADKKSPVASTGEWFMKYHRLVFWRILLTFLFFSDKKTEDQPKTPTAASNVDLIPQETL